MNVEKALTVCQYDTLIIDFDVRNPDGSEYTPISGDKFWLTVKNEDYGTALINLKVSVKHFQIDEITIEPGNYPLEIGLIHADETCETLVQETLKVKSRLRGVDE